MSQEEQINSVMRETAREIKFLKEEISDPSQISRQADAIVKNEQYCHDFKAVRT